MVTEIAAALDDSVNLRRRSSIESSVALFQNLIEHFGPVFRDL
jgi:hypothetical protein